MKKKKLYKVSLNGKILYKWCYSINQLDFLLRKEYPGIKAYDYTWNIVTAKVREQNGKEESEMPLL